MKFFESRFEDYIEKNINYNLHPKLDKIFNKFPKINNISNLKNIIFYGPKGVGKYTQMLKFIKNYSITDLKYERKICILFEKQNYFLKVSDIHYEIDLSLLGCKPKLLWHEIFQQITDIISSKNEKTGIIVCKYFHEIHNELLDNFYSYMEKNFESNIDIKFIIITEQISFIPDNILNCCEIINIQRPNKNNYNKFIKNKLPKDLCLDNITNIKLLHINDQALLLPYKIICDKLINILINSNNLEFIVFRDILYDIFIYNLDIYECIWYILYTLINKHKINDSDLSIILIKTYKFFQYYNNNYRPIYHIENYLLYLTTKITK